MATRARNLADLLGSTSRTESTIPIESIPEGVGVSSFSSSTVLPNTGNEIGDQAFVEDTSRLYIWNGTGWYNIALINTTPTWDSGGQPLSSYELDGDSPQTATIITLLASDPEGLPISYSYVTGGSMDSIATVSQDSSVFTITPKTSLQAPDGGTGTITFRASDGVNIIPQVSSFTLAFPAQWSLATQQAKLQASDRQSYDFFGISVSISNDGNTAIVGARAEDTTAADAGSAYIFTRSGSTWSQQAKIQASDAEATDNFGHSVSISSDGNTAIVSAYLEDTTAADAGSAYIFTRSGSTWSQQAKLQASDAEASDQFGYSVAISGDGDTVIVGARLEDTTATSAGSAYIFTRSGSTWSQQAKIQASDAQLSDNFGYSVSISSDGNTAIIGAYLEDGPPQTGDRGAAYIFTRSGSTWTEEAQIYSTDIQAGDLFGWHVSISGDGNTAIVGAYGEDTGGTNVGSAYIFTRSGSTWTQEAKIQASDALDNDNFGYSVAISNNGNTAIVGAHAADTTATNSGAAYIFTRSGTTWTQQAKIQASDAEASDYFGISVAMSGDENTVIVGASHEDTPGTQTGSAYVFIGG